MISKKTFYILSLVWGFPMTLAGIFVAVVLFVLGYEPKKWCDCCYFEIGEHWGGFNLGPVFLIQKYTGDYLKDHEHGHAIQNCFLGPLMPIVIVLPSVIRYWYRESQTRRGIQPKTGYYDIWFERMASDFGVNHRAIREKEL